MIQNSLNLLLFLLILLGPFPLALSYLSLSQYWRWHSSLAHRLLFLLTTWSVLSISMGLVLGALGQLKLGVVIAADLVLLVGGFLLLRHKVLPEGQILKLLLPINLRLEKHELLILNSVGFVGVYLLVTLLTSPIVDFDSLWFHLPAIARWYQAQALTLLDPSGSWIFDHPDATSYPYNWHVLALLCLLPFRNDILVAFPQLIAWIMLGLSVYLLGREFGANRFYSLASMALLLSTPIIMGHVIAFQVDLPLASIFLTSLYFAYSCHRTRSPIEFSLFIASLGLLIGIKIIAVCYAVLIAGFWAVLEIHRLVTIKKRHRDAALFLADDFDWHSLPPLNLNRYLFCLTWGFFFLLTCYWYVSDYREFHIALAHASAQAHTPVFKTASESLSISTDGSWSKLLQQLNQLQQSTLTYQFNFRTLSHWKSLASYAIPKFQIPIVVMMAQVLLLPYGLLRNPKKIVWTSLLPLIALCFLVGFFYWNTPYTAGGAGSSPDNLGASASGNMRYGFPFVGFLAVTSAVAANITQTSRKIVLLMVWLSGLLGIIISNLNNSVKVNTLMGYAPVGASNFLLERLFHGVMGKYLVFLPSVFFYSVFYIVITVLIAQLLNDKYVKAWRLDLSPVLNRNTKYSVIGISLIFTLICFSAAQAVRDAQRTEVYGGIHEYLDQTMSSGEKIAYFSSRRCYRGYLLAGKDLNRTVLHRQPDLDNPAQWVGNLHQEGVNLVAIGPLLDPTSPEGQFQKKLVQDKVLSPIFGQNSSGQAIAIFRLN